MIIFNIAAKSRKCKKVNPIVTVLLNITNLVIFFLQIITIKLSCPQRLK